MNERLLEDLVNQLRELVLTLGGTGRSTTSGGDSSEKISNSFDRSSTKIVTAIGKLAAQLDKNTRGKQAEQRSLKQFINEVDRATDAQEAYVKAADAVADAAMEQATAQQEAAKITRDSAQDQAKKSAKSSLDAFRKKERESQNYAAIQAEEEQRLRVSRNNLKDSLQSMAGESLNAQRAALFTADALDMLGSMAKGAASTLADLGQNGFTSFNQLNSVVDTVTGAIAKMGASIPFLGAAMTATAEATKFALTQIQQVADNFRELSQVGALTADGMTGVRQALLDSGLTQQGLTNIVKQNSAAFSMLGGTVGDGTVKFSKFVGNLTKDTSRAGLQLRQLGLSADDMGEAAAAYVEIQGRLGTSQRMTQDQLSEGTVRYTRELDIISKITGQTRKELQDSQKAALDEQRFRAKIDAMQRSGQGEAAQNALNLSAALQKVAPEAAKGFRDIFAAGGSATTTEATKLLAATDGAIVGIVQQLARGGDIGDALGQLQTALGKTTDRVNTTAQFADISSYLGNYSQLLDVTKLSAGDLKTAIQSAKETQDKQAAGLDEYTTQVVTAQQQLELAAKEVQELGFNLATFAIPAVTTFSEVLNKVAGTINKELGGTGVAGDGAGTMAETAGGYGGVLAGTAAGAKLGMKYGSVLGIKGVAAGGLIGGVVGGAAGYFGGRSAGRSAAAGGGAPSDATSTPSTGAALTGPSGAEDTSSATAINPTDVLQFTARSGSASAFAGLDSGLQKAVLAAASDYNSATGNKIIINSAKRELADQERLYAAYVARGRTGMPVADPKGKPSKHILGHAVDIQNYEDPAAVTAMNRQGLRQTVANDPVHFSFGDGGIASGPKSGYKAMLHGTEAVVPLPDGKKIPVNMQESSNSNMSKQIDMMGAQLMRLDEMVTLMRRQVGTGDKLLRVSQS
jgi:Ca2+-binding EF-hand superfamily protein